MIPLPVFARCLIDGFGSSGALGASGVGGTASGSHCATTKTLVPLAALLVGTVISVAVWAARSSSVAAMTETATGRIVQVDTRKTKESRHHTETNYRPVIRYEDDDHVEHTAKSVYETTNRHLHNVGDDVEIRYDPRDEDKECVIVGEESLPKLKHWACAAQPFLSM